MTALVDAGGWPGVLRSLIARRDLTETEAHAALSDILEGNATSAQIAAFATLIHAKGESADELRGLVRAMLDHAVPIPIEGTVLDTCGSGGSEQRRLGAFNVSTIASVVAAGAGARIAKHGGRSASGTSSSADVLAALGVAVELDAGGVAQCVEEVGMGFCFAPTFHPALRHAGPTRRELGTATVFNFIAPLCNPARPQRQVVGVSDPSLAEKMVQVLAANGAERVMAVYGHDGLDELTTTGPSTVVEWRDGNFARFDVDPRDLGFALAAPDAIRGGDAAVNAALATRILDGERSPYRDLVCLNAAAGLVTFGVAPDLAAGVAAAHESIDSGRAAGVLDRLVEVSSKAAARS